MKIVNIAIFVGTITCALIYDHPPLYAQSKTIETPLSIEGDDKPWNQGIPLPARETARALFLDGNRLFYLPQYTQAAEKYSAAIAKWKHPAFHFNLALTQLNLGRELEAHENLRQAVRHGEEPLGTLSFREAQKQLADLERRLGRIHVTCATAGAEVTVDGVRLFIGPGSYEGWIQAKTHEITARAEEYLTQTRRVTVSAGKLETLDLRLITLSDAEDAGRRWAAWKPWTVVAAGTTIAVAGGVFHVLAWRNFSTFDNEFQLQPCASRAFPICHERAPEYPAPKNLYSRLDVADRQRTIAMASYITGGSLLAVGITLLYVNRSHLSEQKKSTARSLKKATASPLVSDNTLGIIINMNY